MHNRVRYLVEVFAIVVLVFVGLLFAGGRIAPCLGGIGAGQDEARRACAAAWVATLSPIDRFTYDHPEAILVGLIVLAMAVVIAIELAWRAVSGRRAAQSR